jgi:hypothetical protein
MGRKGSGPLAGQVTQATLDQVAGDRAPDRLGDHETDQRPCGRTRLGALRRRHEEMDHDQGTTAAPATAHDLPEVNR